MALLLNTSNLPCDDKSLSNSMLDSTVGALLIGTFISLMLYGIALNQSFRFFRWFPDNGWTRSKGLAVAVMLLESAHSVLCMHMCYHELVTNNITSKVVTARVWSANILGVFSGTIISLCHSFLARFLYKARGHYRIQVVVTATILSLGQFATNRTAMATAATVLLYLLPPDQDAKFTIRLLNCTHSGLAVAANVLLATALIICLRRQRTGFRKTDSMIWTLIFYTVNGGLLIGAITLLSFVFALVWPRGQVYMAVDIVATKIYANTLLAKISPKQDMPHVLENLETESVSARGCFSNLIMPPKSHVRDKGRITSIYSRERSRSSTPNTMIGLTIMVTKEVEVTRDSMSAVDKSNDRGQAVSFDL